MSGLLGKMNVEPGGNRWVYTSPGNAISTVNINLCNRENNASTVWLMISLNGPPGDDDYIEYNIKLPPFGVLERTGLAMSAGERIYVSTTTWASIRVHGFVEGV